MSRTTAKTEGLARSFDLTLRPNTFKIFVCATFQRPDRRGSRSLLVAKKQLKKTKRKINPLTVALKQLKIADRDAGRAFVYLERALIEPVDKPRLKLCQFKIGKKKYSVTVTPDQCKIIQDVVKQNGDVVHKVQELVADVNKAVDQCLETLAPVLGVTSASRKKATADQVQPRQLIAPGLLRLRRRLSGESFQVAMQSVSAHQLELWEPELRPLVPSRLRSVNGAAAMRCGDSATGSRLDSKP